jgi:hypothetical protein
MNIEELKMELQIAGDDVINVFFVTSSWDTDTFRGLATYPWEKNVYSTMGIDNMICYLPAFVALLYS